ncbi:hypothetical protein LPJ61_003864, partial [Coemansia biformis]
SLVVRVGVSPGGNQNPISTGLGVAQTQELREALATFQAKKEAQHGPGGGKSYFFIDSFDDQMTYYLASAFSDIAVHPAGYLPLTGISSTQFYFKDLADRLGIDVHVEARKDYKSVVAPFSQSRMPEKHRENMMSLLESLNTTFIGDVARSRAADITSCAQASGSDSQPATAAEVVRKAMEEGPIAAPDAQRLGLVTAQDYLFDVGLVISRRKALSVGNYLRARKREAGKTAPKPQKSDDEGPVTVGVVYLAGGIERRSQLGAHRLSRALLEAAKDTDVGGIVLRIDSGGGDVIASDTIGATVDYVQTKFGKPVVASYGNVSASGAYYASASCKRIFASPGTITGSIGVAAMRPIFTRKLLGSIGTNVEELYTIDNRSGSLFLAPQGAELERHRKLVDAIYATFTERVAKGRGYSREGVEQVAQGRIFTGTQALSNGLVDEMGGFTRAIEAAAQMAYGSQVEILKKSVVYRLESLAKALDSELPPLVFNDEAASKQPVAAGASTPDKPIFKADITRNIRVKEFPEEKGVIRILINSFMDGDIDSALDCIPTAGIGALLHDAVSGGVSAAFENGLSSLLSRDPHRLLEQSARRQQGARAESSDTEFK